MQRSRFFTANRSRTGLFRPGEWSPRGRIALVVIVVIAILLSIYFIYLRSQEQALNLEVVNSTGSPVALARVYIDEGERLLTDENGQLLVEGLPWGRGVQLRIEHSEYVIFDQRLEAGTFADERQVEIILYKPARLVGIVTNHDGEPIEGVDIRFKTGGSYARSAVDGSFAVENIAHGERTLVYGRGEEIQELLVTIAPEITTEIELLVGPEPTPTPSTTAEPTETPGESEEPTPTPTATTPATPRPTPAPTTPPTTDGTFVYRAVPDDSLTGIARKFNAPYSEIYRLNPQYQSNPDFLPVGGEVRVPCTVVAQQQGYCN